MSLRHPIAVFVCMAMAMALLWSKALLSFTMVILAVVASVDIQIHPLRIRWLLTPKRIRESINSRPYLWVFALFFLLYLVSIIYAGDISAWWALTHPKIAFLLIPLAFAMLDPFSRKDYMAVVLSMILMAVWSSVWVQVGYYENYYLFNRSLGFGGSLPAPTNHIRYSVIVAISMVICLSFAIEDKRYRFRWERWVYGVLAAYLFYFLHVLSVRTGLALGYAGIAFLILSYMRHLKRWKQMAMIGMMILAPIVAYKSMPGFEQKINYTLYDLGKFNEGEGESYSDSERWQSWRAGIEVGNQHPFFGTGTGKFRQELKSYYATKLNKETYERPHNQYINVFTCFGLFGLAIFLFTLVYPMTASVFWNEPLLPTLFIMQLLSMLVEHPLDTEVGTSLFLLMTLVGLSYYSGKAIEVISAKYIS
ncbi:MAG TPA: O-antigen ligase family protein [Saprospiraceae bacterium]